MRATCEIVADLKDGKEVPYEELKMACLVQSSIIFFLPARYEKFIKRRHKCQSCSTNEL